VRLRLHQEGRTHQAHSEEEGGIGVWAWQVLLWHKCNKVQAFTIQQPTNFRYRYTFNVLMPPLDFIAKQKRRQAVQGCTRQDEKHALRYINHVEISPA